MAPTTFQVLSVNIAQARLVTIQGLDVLTAMGKASVPGPVEVRPLGLAGDEQADQTVHGGLSKAIYAYPVVHYAFWQTVRAQAQVAAPDQALAPGAMGENLTLAGLQEGQLWIGDRLRLPGCVLAVSEPRMPCYKFSAAMGFPQAVSLMAQSGYSGVYLAVIEPGTVGAGEVGELLPGPREVNLRELFLSRMGRR
ncbi:MOSC domain-containing protein [Ideonella sp. A 288]|uniref:MOSC domain-containing protein n=1 Tax=Ideonella sp. A 288 TaxID=1962181 RepID=UPI000B4BD1C0|nr:MOSC domain-containing protein [Ideonella sp. A 288]